MGVTSQEQWELVMRFFVIFFLIRAVFTFIISFIIWSFRAIWAITALTVQLLLNLFPSTAERHLNRLHRPQRHRR